MIWQASSNIPDPGSAASSFRMSAEASLPMEPSISKTSPNQPSRAARIEQHERRVVTQHVAHLHGQAAAFRPQCRILCESLRAEAPRACRGERVFRRQSRGLPWPRNRPCTFRRRPPQVRALRVAVPRTTTERRHKSHFSRLAHAAPCRLPRLRPTRRVRRVRTASSLPAGPCAWPVPICPI